MLNIKDYFAKMAAENASDLYLSVDYPTLVRVEGRTKAIDKTHLYNTNELKELAEQTMKEVHYKADPNSLEINFRINDPELGSFRINIYREQQQHHAIAIHRIPPRIPSIEELGLPEILKTLIMLKQGLVLIVGARGFGKTVALASLIEYRNQNISNYIVTVENPIQHIFTPAKSIISQRQVGIDTLSYESALENAPREAVDVMMINEIKTSPVMQQALESARTGYLCLSSMHSDSTTRAITAIASLFPPERRSLILSDLSETLKAIVAQRLVTDLTGKRIPIFEVLLVTPEIAKLIREGNMIEINYLLSTSKIENSQSFDDDLYRLYKEKKISIHEALDNAEFEYNLRMRFNLDNDNEATSHG